MVANSLGREDVENLITQQKRNGTLSDKQWFCVNKLANDVTAPPTLVELPLVGPRDELLHPLFQKHKYGRLLKERRLAEMAEERATRRAARVAEREAKIVAKAKATLARIEARMPYKSPKHDHGV